MVHTKRIPLVIDFETAYSQTYSLSKMTTAEYVLSPYFDIIGVAVKLGDAATEWFSGKREDVREWLKQFPFEDDGYTTIIQNSHFDGPILEWILDIHPAHYFCTRMAARPLVVPFCKSASLKVVADYLGIGQKGTEVASFIGMWRRDFTPAQLAQYGEYCKNDVELTRKMYDVFAPQLPDDEQELIHLTTTKFTRPRLELDLNVLTARLAEVRHEKAEVLRLAQLENPDDLMSNPKFAAALERFGVEPPMKVSPATGKQTYAFAKNDPEFKELLEHDEPRVQALVAARLKHKSTQEETRLERFISQYHLGRPLAVPQLYFGAHTGRWSGLDKLNMQNLPRGSALRAALVAPPGHVILAGDLAQIEARTAAYLAGADSLVDRFASGADPYRWFAANRLYHTTEDQVTKEERFIAKTCLLGMQYGVGAPKYHKLMRASNIDMSEYEAKRIVNAYRTAFHQIPRLWNFLDTALSYMAEGKRYQPWNLPVIFGERFIALPSGMRLQYPNLRLNSTTATFCYDSHRGTKTLWGGALLENIVQALTRIILSDAELFMARRGMEAVLSVHDELVYVVPERSAEKFAIALERVLTRPVPWLPGLPIAAEVKWGKTYLECK